MVWIRGNPASDARLNLDAIQAQAMLFCYLKLLHFMRGLDQTGVLVHMLVSIVLSIGPFMLVLGVVLAAFASAVYLMLRHDIEVAANAAALNDEGDPQESLFNSYGISVFGIIGMMFGQYDMTYFRNSPYVHRQSVFACGS